jgi:hypothetical protein
MITLNENQEHAIWQLEKKSEKKLHLGVARLSLYVTLKT